MAIAENLLVIIDTSRFNDDSSLTTCLIMKGRIVDENISENNYVWDDDAALIRTELMGGYSRGCYGR